MADASTLNRFLAELAREIEAQQKDMPNDLSRTLQPYTARIVAQAGTLANGSPYYDAYLQRYDANADAWFDTMQIWVVTTEQMPLGPCPVPVILQDCWNGRSVYSYSQCCNPTGYKIQTNECPIFCDPSKPPSCTNPQIGSKIEYRIFNFPCGTTASQPFCETNPTDCCFVGSGSGGAGILTACCPNNPINPTLYSGLTDSGGCACIGGTQVVLNGTSGTWTGSAYDGCPLTFNFIVLDLACVTIAGQPKWQLSVDGCGQAQGLQGTLISASCNPFQLVFSVCIQANRCCGKIVPDPNVECFTVTITE
jgi:hypothetical protein